MSAGWMPWKCRVCGCSDALVNRTRSRSPSVQRSVGPGMRPLSVHAGKTTPGATSISLSTAVIDHSRSVRPSGIVEVRPRSKSRRMSVGLNPFASWSTVAPCANIGPLTPPPCAMPGSGAGGPC